MLTGYIRVHSQRCTCHEFSQIRNDVYDTGSEIIPHYDVIWNRFTVLKVFRALLFIPSSSSKLLAITDLSAVSIILPFPELHKVGIT